jgi:hypothetical protein
MQPTTQNLRGFSLIGLLACVVIIVTALTCLSVTLLLSDHAAQLYRTWRAVRVSFFVFLCFFIAMSFVLDAILQRVPQVRRQVLLSTNAKRVAMTALIFAIAIVSFYPPRPFVYAENGHWISKSKAGTWEVNQDVAIDSYKQNITWDCMIILAMAVVQALVAIACIQRTSPQTSQFE